ncbi:ankyrin repeat domain-containing protein [Sphingomonas sp. KR1UV-12]|uniref:Ankyrin repeat domain-containing protein n=1 Tax=Sphingomonas aurea TaxID=3063994 RepID=A0ABT9ELJ9_9SPHN|nr:ankyrin repeat domain-containing protein [Sphingomonas sp. KR1UV-12]MDP1027842.1 ankyrin repeat domain-containing protein [Sphingomonas sp. KR1UV-12]
MKCKPLILAMLALAAPVTAQQQSESYKFLQAVKDAKGNEVIDMLDRPGSNLVNARETSSGEGALHIVVKRGDDKYVRYLLQKGADPNLRDRQGNTPLLLATQLGQRDLLPILIAGKANPNLGNQSGVTPLIAAVQSRSIDMVRVLTAAGADPDQKDVIAGLSARDYAEQDGRSGTIAKLFAETPKRAKPAVAGPRL